MKVSQEGIDLIKHFEGFANKSYICLGGAKTIGYGHKLKLDEHLDEIDQTTAELILQKDLEACELAVLRNINVALNQNQFDALVSFTFNVGAGALQRSTLRQKINREDHHLVSNELKKWVYAGEKKLVGLLLRREAEAALYTATTIN
jgi:lysozyme